MALKENSGAAGRPVFQESRGLGAFLARLNLGRAPQNPDVVPLSQICPDPNQPRKNFAPAEIAELAASIKFHGLLQPLIVTPAPEGDAKYRIVAGERRFQACKLAGLSEVPVRVVRGDSRTLLQLQLVENLQREDLTPIETATALRDLIERQGLTHGELAAGIGWTRAAVSNKIRILSLPKEVLALIAEGKLTEGHAKALLSLAHPADIPEFARGCIKYGWSVRSLSERVEYANTHKKTVMRFSPAYKAWRPKGAAPLARRLGIKIGASGDGTTNRIVLRGLTCEQVSRLIEVLEKSADYLNPTEKKVPKKG